MEKFQGFKDKNPIGIEIPEPFFRDLLPQINDLDELKITLYAFWRLNYVEGIFKFFRMTDVLNDRELLAGIAERDETAVERTIAALDKAVKRGTLLKAELKQENGSEFLYFLNTPKNQAAVNSIKNGKWKYKKDSETYFIEPPSGTRNIFQLYEENIGPITPMLADSLGDIEDTYPELWIEEAFKIAVENNKRSLSYIEAILKRWHEGGKNGRRAEADFKKSGKEYIDGEFSDFIEH